MVLVLLTAIDTELHTISIWTADNTKTLYRWSVHCTAVQTTLTHEDWTSTHKLHSAAVTVISVKLWQRLRL